MRKNKNLGQMLLPISTILSISSCKKSDPIVETNTDKIAENSTFGKILTDSKGMSLYLFSDDVKGTSECIEGCLNAWNFGNNLTIIAPVI